MGQPRFEVPSGTINGTNTVFTVSVPYVVGSTAVWINGALLEQTLDDGWLESNPATGEITLKEAPRSSGACPDVLQVFFKDTSADLPETVVSEICGTIVVDADLCGTLMLTEDALVGCIGYEETLCGLLSDSDSPRLSGVLETCDEIVGIIVGNECL